MKACGEAVMTMTPRRPRVRRSHGRAGAVEGATKIDRHHAVPFLLGGVPDRAAEFHAGIGMEDVDAAKGVLGGAHHHARSRGGERAHE
jgi:hypothetical protein